MKRASLLGVTFLACAAATACDIPAAVFDGGTSTSTGGTSTDGGSAGQTTATHPTGGSGGRTGTGGSSTGGSSTGGSTTGGSGGTTTTTTTLTGPTVTCNYPNISECNPGEVCCYARNALADTCKTPGNCDPPGDYIEVKCDQPEDCTGGKLCCAYYVVDGPGLKLEKTYCDTVCDFLNDYETPACHDDFDCDVPFTCQQLFSTDYPDSYFCLSP